MVELVIKKIDETNNNYFKTNTFIEVNPSLLN